MRRRMKGAAALLVLAPVLLGGLWARQARAWPLTIEVIAGSEAGEASPASVQSAMQEGDEERPRVLLYATHTWEAYEMTEDTQYTPTQTWRTKDERYNMTRIAQELAACLTAQGFSVVHDETAFEPPNLSDAYARSLDMLEARLTAGESYDYILDIHRDAYSGPYNGANAVRQGARSVAYVMMLVGKGTGATGAGFDARPDWPKNLDLARRVTAGMNAQLPGVARDVKIKSGRFNQHVSTGALLIEVGNNQNTLDEALAACPVIAKALADAHAARSD